MSLDEHQLKYKREYPLHGSVLWDPLDKAANTILTAVSDVNSVDEWQQTLLHAAACRKDGRPLVQMLLLLGADRNRKDQWRDTPLSHAQGRYVISKEDACTAAIPDLESGLSRPIPDDIARLLFRWACTFGSVRLLDALLNFVSPSVLQWVRTDPAVISAASASNIKNPDVRQRLVQSWGVQVSSSSAQQQGLVSGGVVPQVEKERRDEEERMRQQAEKEKLELEKRRIQEDKDKLEQEKRRFELHVERERQELEQQRAQLSALQLQPPAKTEAPQPPPPQAPAQPPQDSIPVTLHLYDPPNAEATVHVITDPSHGGPVPLGEGGYGAVYKAFYNGRPAALKVFKLQARTAEEAEELSKIVRKEAKFLTSLGQNEYIVPVYAAGDVAKGLNRTLLGNLSNMFEPCPAVVMQLADCTLWHALHAPQACPPEIVARLQTTSFKTHALYAVSIALVDCHLDPMNRRNIKVAHRDVKSGNVLLTAHDYYRLTEDDKLISNVLLCDFGVSHEVRNSMGNSTFTAKAGTPSYMAPEIMDLDEDANSASLDLFATDVFSFGILMWEVLSGLQPFAKMDPLKAAMAIAKGKRPTPELTADNLVQGGWTREHANVLTSLVTRCWAQDPKDRPMMETIQGELRPLLPDGHFGDY